MLSRTGRLRLSTRQEVVKETQGSTVHSPRVALALSLGKAIIPREAAHQAAAARYLADSSRLTMSLLITMIYCY